MSGMVVKEGDSRLGIGKKWWTKFERREGIVRLVGERRLNSIRQDRNVKANMIDKVRPVEQKVGLQ